MESDFVTRQHIDSLTPASDPAMAEVLNNYKFPPKNPPQMPTPAPMMGGYPAPYPYFGGSNNDMLLGNILGQMQAKLDKQENVNNFNGLQFNISMEILRWFVLILVLALLVWLVLKITSKKKSPLNRRLRKIEKEMKKMRRFRKRNPKQLKDDSMEDNFLEDDFEEDI